LGQFNLPGSSGAFGGGGAVATASTTSGTNDYACGYPGSTTPVGQYSMTSGLRSGGAILGQPSIDALIHSGQTPSIDSKSPGAFSIAGVFTDPQFQLVIRALSQKKGVDLMTSPAVVTKSGQRATIVVARELPYPTEFNPPQIPTQVGGRTNATFVNGGLANQSSSRFAPITPTTPTAFAKRDVGITMEVEPVVDPNNRIVHLNVVPSSTEFEGFVDYGSPIMNGAPIGFGGATVFYTQPNHILQPIFRTNKTSTAVDIWDGNTLVLAGVVTETRTDIQDKVPVLGSLPIIGRAFQSKVSQVERKNVAFFVSVRIIDPAGNNINQILPSALPATPPAAGGPAPATALAP
jgi:general secretion pathway protein D